MVKHFSTQSEHTGSRSRSVQLETIFGGEHSSNWPVGTAIFYSKQHPTNPAEGIVETG